VGIAHTGNATTAFKHKAFRSLLNKTYHYRAIQALSVKATENPCIKTKQLNFQLEQVQDFTPTPMTLATVMYYTGIAPYKDKSVFTAKTQDEKLNQRQFFFWYKPEDRQKIRDRLVKIGKRDLID